MLDALIPAARNFTGSNVPLAFAEAAKAARQGSDSTIGMLPRRGRAQYLSERVRNHRDGGAEAIALLLEALSAFLSSSEAS